jgi:hypothetical protein
MSVLSVRLPRELDRALPKRDRSAWVIAAIRERLRRQRIESIAQSAAEHEREELETLSEWEPATAPLLQTRMRRSKR